MKCYGFGFFANEPVLETLNNTVCCKFVLGVKERIRKNGLLNETVRYFNFVVWAEAAEVIISLARKGSEIYFEAVPRDEDRNGRISFRITDFQLVRKNEKNTSSD